MISTKMEPKNAFKALQAEVNQEAEAALKACARWRASPKAGKFMLITHHRHLIDVARAALPDQTLAVHSL